VTIEAYLDELRTALHVRGRARRRFLRECRDHLADAAAERGEADAVRAFGPPAEIAAAFDTEVATRRGLRSTLATAAGVAAVGCSTLALIHAASTGATAPVIWAIAFFVAAQVSGTAAALALLEALRLRRRAATPADVLLLARRNACALVAAALTLLAAGGAVPGQASALVLLAGPAVACAAFASVLRTRALARRLDGAREPVVRPPFPAIPRATLLAGVTGLAACAAFARDRADEHASPAGALAVAALEATAVLACYLTLGRPLGLWSRRS
jgi:HAAS domain-containing protein